MRKNLTTSLILTAVAFAGGILLTNYLRRKKEDKNTGVNNPPSPNTPPNEDTLNFSGNVSGTSEVILDGMSEEQANKLREELK